MLRLRMQLATNRESLFVKYQQNSNGARFATRFSVGRVRDSLFTLALRENLHFNEAPTITVIGKAFFDVGHAPKDQSDRRKYQPNYAAWEIHPVMKLETL